MSCNCVDYHFLMYHFTYLLMYLLMYL
jgi:hypothetical protein